MAGGGSVGSTSGFSQEPRLHHRGVARRKSHAPKNYDEEAVPIPDQQEEGPAPVTVRHVFEGLFHTSHHEHASHSQQVDIEHYIHDKSFRRRLILLSLSNSKIGIRVQFFRTFIFFIGCLLYVAEATYYDYWGEDIDMSVYNSTYQRELARIGRFFLYTDKPLILWTLQVSVGVVALSFVSLQLYARVNDCSLRGVMKVIDYSISIQLIIGIMYIITLMYPPILRNLIVPLFLFCWPGRQSLSAAIIQSATRQFGTAPKTFTVKAISLASFLICFTFTWVCLLHRVELVNTRLHFFDTIWFVLVTLSSVGYGDIHPAHYAGKLLVMLFIILGVIVILPQLEELYNAFQTQKRLHNRVSYTDSHKHVILCSSELKPMVLRDFFSEFYSDPKNLDVHCVLLVEKDLPPFMKVYLSHPIWSSRITVLIGSPMRRADLVRARVDTATACFIHTSRSEPDPATADQHTVISAWSVKNSAPDCKLYVHTLLPETRLHLDLADQVLCEGEMKLALMANHIHCPGISTLVTLLLHTFKSELHNFSNSDYQLYDCCSSCEVYDSRVGDSKYFYYFIGKNFLFASVVAYRKYQVTLLGVRPKSSRQILLNPGLHYVLDQDDVCYYIGFTREEYSKVREGPTSTVHTALWQTCASIALLSLAVAGIDTEQLREEKMEDSQIQTEMGDPFQWESEESESVKEDGGKRGIERVSSILSQRSVQFYIPDKEDGTEPVMSKTTKELSAGDGQSSECKRGLKLLRYHSRMDIHANPVVKVNVQTPLASPDHEVEWIEEVDGSILKVPPTVCDDLHVVEEGRSVKSHPPDIKVTPSTKDRRRLRRSVSDKSLTDFHNEQSTLNSRQGILYSSRLSLVHNSSKATTHAPTEDAESSHVRLFPHHLSEVLRRMSSWSTHRPSLAAAGDFKGSQEVVLNLEDVEEERELEELEDGRCGGDEEEEESADEAIEETDSITQPSSLPQHTCSHRYVKGALPCLPYCGCDCVRFHLLPECRPHHLLHLNEEERDSPSADKEGGSQQWPMGGVIVYSEEATQELYHLLLPLRAHYLHTAELRPITLFLGKDPSPSFLDLVSPLPMVHFITGDINSLDTWLRAGVLECESVIITGGRRPVHDQEHMVDATHILATQKISKLFPHVNVMTELHYRYNIRFLQPDNYIMSGGVQRADHLTYLFQPQFAGGRAFCASMLDTMLYQSHSKPYIIELMGQLLGCQQMKDSAYLWKLEVGEELLKLQTYDRLFQRVVTVHHCVPLGLYRTVPLSSCSVFRKYYSQRVAYDPDRFMEYLRSRLKLIGKEVDDDVMQSLERDQAMPTQSFVLVNPPHKTRIHDGDVLLTLRPHHAPPPSHPPHNPLDTDCDSGVDQESPPHPPTHTSSSPHPTTLTAPPPHHPTLPSSPNTVIVAAECH